MANRRLLPIGALIVSLIIFGGALVFALQPTRNAPAATPTVHQAAAVNPVAGTSVVVAANGTATSAPIVEVTATSAAPAATAAPATATAAPVVTTRTAAPVAATPSLAAPVAVAPTVAVPPVAAAVTPTDGVSAGALPPAITPAAPPPADVSAAPTAAPPVAAAPTAVPLKPTQAPPVQPTRVPVAAAPPTQPPPAPPTTAPAAPIPPVTTGAAPKNVGVPVRVIIPSIGVDATVEQVGVDADGAMATPEDPWNTGWYAPGVRPGQPGNAAIAGHVDYHGIGPVVFWDLNKLTTGAEVLVVTDAGQTLRFTVRGSEYYTPDNAPLLDIFGPANTVNLNLITCGGTFNPATRHYDQRLVLFTSYAGQ